MSYDGWLERPYQEAAEQSEADERARELGYGDADEMWESMRDEAAEAKWERENDR